MMLAVLNSIEPVDAPQVIEASWAVAAWRARECIRYVYWEYSAVRLPMTMERLPSPRVKPRFCGALSGSFNSALSAPAKIPGSVSGTRLEKSHESPVLVAVT